MGFIQNKPGNSKYFQRLKSKAAIDILIYYQVAAIKKPDPKIWLYISDYLYKKFITSLSYYSIIRLVKELHL